MSAATAMMSQAPAQPQATKTEGNVGQQPAGPGPAGMGLADAPFDQDPAFVEAVNYVREKLYKGEEGDKIHKVAKGSKSVVGPISIIAYNATSAADKATGGEVIDENLVGLAMYVMAEVIDVFEASGNEISDGDVSEIFKIMLVRFLEENNLPTDKIKKAIDQISADEFTKIKLRVEKFAGAAQTAANENPENSPPEEMVEEPEEEMEEEQV